MVVSDRSIRVFVSSTFKDMHEERDHLVKFVFPHLRKRCESRGVTWAEVDLRWGITEAEAERGDIVQYCLDEIDHCRPYFIGLLGDVLGAITEREFVHGVLARSERAEHAFFYFRRTIGDCGALKDLKDRIRRHHAQGLLAVKPREGYRNVQVLGRAIRRDLARLIDRTYPADEQPDAFERERLEHEALVRSRAHVYIGREEAFARLDAHAVGDGPPLVVLGESGVGKSALLANWFVRGFGGDFALIHFFGGTRASADPIHLLRRIMAALRARFPERLGEDVAADPDAIREAFPRWLAHVCASARIVLILDGLDQLEDHAADLTWLPPAFPSNCRVILSTLPGRSLDALARRKWLEATFTVAPLSEAERRRLLAELLEGRYSKRLPASAIDAICSEPATANPLFLRALAEELRQLGGYDELRAQLRHYLNARDPKELYSRILERWERDYSAGRALVWRTCALIAAARRGLSEAEMLDLLGGEGRPLPRAIWTPFLLAADASLAQRSGLLSFSHRYLRDAVEELWASEDDHRRLADYFDAQPGLGRRKVDELPWQHRQAGEWTRLGALMADVAFVVAAWNANPLDVRESWALLREHAALDPAATYRALIDDPDAGPEQTWTVANLLWDLGHPKEVLALRRRLVDLFRRSGDRRRLMGALVNYGVSLRTSGDIAGAAAAYFEVLEISEELDDATQYSLGLGNLAVIFQMRGDIARALQLLGKQERISRALGNHHQLALTLGHRALILKRQGKFEDAARQATFLRTRRPREALRKHVEAEAMRRALGEPRGLAMELGGQANVLALLDRYDEALQKFDEAERLFASVGDKDGIAQCLSNRANVEMKRGDLTAAERSCERAERIYRELDAPRELSSCLGTRGYLLRLKGDLAGAAVLFQEQQSICQKIGDRASVARALGSRALVLKEMGKSHQALLLHRQEEEIFRELPDPAGLHVSLGNQAMIHLAGGDTTRAWALLDEDEALCRQLGVRADLARCLGNKAGVLEIRGDLVGAMELTAASEVIFREIGDPAGLAIAVANRAMLMLGNGERAAASALIREALGIAAAHGLKAIESKLASAIARTRL